MNKETQLDSFALTHSEAGYLLRFGTTNCLALFLDIMGERELTGFLKFCWKSGENFKEIDIKQESPKSVLLLIHAQLQYWDLFEFKLVSENNRIADYFLGDCYLNFADQDDVLRYLKVIIPDEGIAVTVYSYLINNIGGAVICDQGRFSVMPAFDMEDLNRPISDESPFD